MKQSDLIKLIANDTGVTYETVRKIIRKTTKYIAIALVNDDAVQLGVGTFSTRLRGEKPVTDFKTGQRYMLPPAHQLRFAPSAYIKGVIRRKNRLEKLEQSVPSVTLGNNNAPDEEE